MKNNILKKINRLDVEIHSKCNRKCSFCPNSDIDRASFNVRLDNTVFIKLLKSLKANGFSSHICFSRFNEPLADLENLKTKIEITKKFLSKNHISIISNGDFFSVKNLMGINVDRVAMMDYDCKGRNKILAKLKNFKGHLVSEENNTLYYQIEDGPLVSYKLNWPRHATLEDRGGYLSEPIKHRSVNIPYRNNRKLRDKPCYDTERRITIEYNGNVMPCCHMRGDIEDHKEYILGNIVNDDIINILNNDKRKSFIRQTSDTKTLPLPCKFCQKGIPRELPEKN